MRTHRTHTVLPPWSTATPVLDVARLIAVRVEPVLRQRKGALFLDLCLGDSAALTVIPGILVDPSLVVGRERDPLVWPHGTPGDDAFLAGLAERVLASLEPLVLSGERVTEHVIRFGDAAAFEAARSAGAFGAAPLRESLTRIAPYRYAGRFVRGRRVLIDAPDAVAGWALLRDRGTVGVAPERQEPALCAWYGEPAEPPGAADVAIIDRDGCSDATIVLRLDTDGPNRVDVVDPLPLDVGLSFDLAEGPAARWFTVERTPEPYLRPSITPEHRPFGGSAGRVVILLGRTDAVRHPGADTDEAATLAAALRAEGFDAIVVEDPEQLSGADLVHLFGTRDGRLARRIVEGCRRAGIPVAVHAHLEDTLNGGWWGVGVTRFCFEYGSDERDVARYVDLLAKRALTLDGITAHAPYAPAGAAVEEAASALRDATVVFAATDEEAEAIRKLGRHGPIIVVAPLAPLPVVPAPIGHLTGPDPFVFVHAPIAPEQNQLMVARACADAAIALVCAGPVVDASYLERVREFGGPDLIVLPEPTAEEAAALRAAAAVVVDAAWIGNGGSRLAAAALAGARLAIADRRRFVAPGLEPARFDPADLVGLTRSIGDGWDAAIRHRESGADAVRILAPGAAVRAIVRGYATGVAPVA